MLYFNPRSRVGSDLLQSPVYRYSEISIHAPAWGATCSLAVSPSGTSHFNPRSRVGSDGHRFVKGVSGCQFQSTLPRGERQRYPPILQTLYYFNPRSRVGSDNILVFGSFTNQYFNPRSRVGSDQ